MGLRAILILIITFVNIPLALAKPFYGLLVYSFFTYARPQGLMWGQLSGLRLSLICGIALVVGVVLNREQLFAKNSRVFLICLFWLFCLISLVLSNPVADQLSQFDFFTKTIIIVVIMTGLINNQKKFYLFCMLITTFIAFYASRQGLFGFLGGARELRGHVDENNFYGLWLCSLWPFIFYMAKTETRKWIKILLYASAPLVLLAILITYSRGAYLGIAAVLFFVALRSRHKIRNLTLIILLGLATFLVMPKSMQDETMSMRRGVGTDEYSVSSRFYYWKCGLIMASRSPLFGIGFKNFENEYERGYVQDERLPRRSVHQTFIQALAENGVIAFCIFVALIVSTFLKNGFLRKKISRLLLPVAEKRQLINWSYMLEAGLVGFCVAGFWISGAYLDILWYLFALSICFEEIAKKTLSALQLNP